MPLGPFDRRKKIFRCVPCTRSHLKCSGEQPCTNCERRRANCTYNKSTHGKAGIELSKGSQTTSSTYASPAKVPPNTSIIRLNITPSQGRTSCYFYHFDVFLERNNFGQSGILSADIKDAARRSSSTYLHDAILSMGAIVAFKLNSQNAPAKTDSYQFALKSYATAVVGLRDALEKPPVVTNERLLFLWTTLILGLFELMIDSSGQGWLQHLVHGTSKALIAAGPSLCRDGLGSRFFVEAKIFEVCRSIIFNDTSFLVEPEWKELSLHVQCQGSKGPLLLDEVLDAILSCSALRVRASNFVRSFDFANPLYDLHEANLISADGFRLRHTLEAWTSKRDHLPRNNEAEPSEDNFTTLARIFHAATSIYLSGVFDYEIDRWNSMEVPVPTLPELEIQQHLGTLLSQSDIILRHSKVSPLLLLFPLRIAGARSYQPWQQQAVLQLLSRIETTFSAAGAFKSDLAMVWNRMTR